MDVNGEVERGNYQKRREVLSSVINILLSHRHESQRLPLEQQNPFALVGIKKEDYSIQNLKKLLLFSIQWRGGPRLSLERINKVLSRFNKCYDVIIKDILPNFSGQDSIDEVYMKLTDIKDIGPKISGVFLRDVVYHLNVWEKMLPYLYLPIDRHVYTLLIKRLQVFSKKEVPNVSESYFTQRNQSFQKALGEIHIPRVDFDDLWFIGSQFCSFRKICPACWIRGFCRNRFEDKLIMNL